MHPLNDISGQSDTFARKACIYSPSDAAIARFLSHSARFLQISAEQLRGKHKQQCEYITNIKE